MNWQIKFALQYIRERHGEYSAEHHHGDAIKVSIPGKPEIIAVISGLHLISAEIAQRCHQEHPEMDFLCGFRKECVWEGGAIDYIEGRKIGWGNAGTLYTAIREGNVNSAAHRDYFFNYRIIKQKRSIKNLNREFDRVFTMTLSSGKTVRVGMISEYEPTADAIRTFWDQFGPIDIAWCINPNGRITQSSIEAAQALGCSVMKWENLKELL